MTELSIHPVKKISEAAIEKACSEMGLTITMKASLKSKEENTHWHFKCGKQKGVLEITLMKATGEITLSVRENRKGGWEADMMHELKTRFVF